MKKTKFYHSVCVTIDRIGQQLVNMKNLLKIKEYYNKYLYFAYYQEYDGNNNNILYHDNENEKRIISYD
jgi:hypothetical protein